MANIPIEIITIILSMLPVKSLLRFKCVCKSWCSLIKSPNFIKLHLNQTLISNSDRHLLLYFSSLHSIEVGLLPNRISFTKHNHPLKPRDTVNFFGSCNGVVCISDYFKNDVFLYNPFTNSSHKIPGNRVPNYKKDGMVFGFGYDSKSDDYKVLRIVQGLQNYENSRNEAKIYSLNKNSWKSIQGMPYSLHYADCNGILVNEAIHFLVDTKESFDPKFCKLIASFDLRTEEFSLMNCPNYDDSNRNITLHLAELGGCLCLMINRHTRSLDDIAISEYDMLISKSVWDDPILERAELWVMKEHGKKESWVKLFSISDPKQIGAYLQIRPLVYSKDGRKILLEIDSKQGIGYFDLKSGIVDGFLFQGILPTKPWEMAYFAGSLVSLEDEVHLDTGTLPKKIKKKSDFLSVGSS